MQTSPFSVQDYSNRHQFRLPAVPYTVFYPLPEFPGHSLLPQLLSSWESESVLSEFSASLCDPFFHKIIRPAVLEVRSL